MASMSLIVDVDDSAALEAISALVEALDRLPKSVNIPFDIDNAIKKSFRAEIDVDTAVPAGGLQIRLEPTDFFGELLAAARTGNFDRLVIEQRHSEPRCDG